LTLSVPKISVIISSYNSAKFIKGRLDNLISQTIFNSLEIIIVLSGSKENEEEIISPYVKNYKNIICIKTDERETIYKAWNRAIKISRGNYITNANTDDRLKADALEILSDYLDSNPDLALVYADQYITNSPNQSFEELKNITGKHCWSDYSMDRLIEASLTGPQPVWRSSLHFKDDIWFNETFEVVGDYDFACQVAVKYKIGHLPLILGVYYKSDNQQNKEYQNSVRTFGETCSVKEKYADIYLHSLSEYQLFNKSKYFRKWANSNILYFYSWKLVMKIINPSKRLQTRQFVIWFSSKIEEYLGNLKQAKSVLQNDYPLAKRQFEHLSQIQKNSDFISVIIPAYNRPLLLVDTLNSLVSQTHGNFEIILVNNGTIDISELVDSYKDKLKINYLVSDIKGNVAAAKNLALKVAKGDFIAYLDDDDWYHPAHLKTLFDELQNGDYLFAYSDAYVELQDCTADGRSYTTVKKFVEYSKEFNRNLLLIKDYIFTPCVMHSRRCYEVVGGFDEYLKTDEDMDLWIRMSKFYDFKHVKKVTCSVRRTNNKNSLTKNWNLMYRNAVYLFNKHHELAKWNLPVILGQKYYLNLRKRRAKESDGAINSYY